MNNKHYESEIKWWQNNKTTALIFHPNIEVCKDLAIALNKIDINVIPDYSILKWIDQDKLWEKMEENDTIRILRNSLWSLAEKNPDMNSEERLESINIIIDTMKKIGDNLKIMILDYQFRNFHNTSVELLRNLESVDNTQIKKILSETTKYWYVTEQNQYMGSYKTARYREMENRFKQIGMNTKNIVVIKDNELSHKKLEDMISLIKKDFKS